ncbi:MAG: hypothetical protein ACLTBU_05435 [Zhenhengia sp.]|jgi:uncharacterized membrane protein AbrB (regulator of aidB expression)|uniref:Uncharacterized protein n=1 Tax=Zhenhengia yiwuensis TaxID=2763666 RepID=A0A926ICU7_9FIRM|nr:hypothetical protein [Zhenhengia yiwuensis]MBC8577926.1 hypothetical protein [Zhenhengia yiwuensis]MDU6360317.1 hypothetical protein [Clostridiales bacterium]
MQQLIERVNSQVTNFKVEDWFIFKMAILIVGAIIGCSFSDTCKKLRPLLIIVWVCAFTYIILRIFILEESPLKLEK